MNWRNVRLVFLREVRDQLRDRRTLFMIFVLPLLLYPSLGIGTVQMQLLFTVQPRTMVLLGTEHLPDLPGHPLLKGSHFDKSVFDRAGETGKITVITDAPQPDLDRKQAERREHWLAIAREMAPDLLALKSLEDQQDAVDKLFNKEPVREKANARVESLFGRRAELEKEIKEVKKRLSHRFTHSELQLVAVIPPGFGRNLQLAGQAWNRTATVSDYPGPLLAFDNALDKSQLTYRSVKDAFKTWESNYLKSQLREADLPEILTEPVHAKGVNVALDEQESSSFWSKLLPALLVIMAMTGAFYPAIDLVAGEKERGTMETLLISPASRIDIVLGKFFTVLAFSCTTVLLNLTSMGLTGQRMISMVAATPLAHRAGELALPSFMQLIWTMILMVPLAGLFSALCLALATLARSSKEGQYYLTPLLMVSMGMTVFCMSPGIDLTPTTAIYTVIPIANVALLLKGLLGPAAAAGQLYYFVAPVLVTSVAYAALALWWAMDQFQREEVLFRDTEQFDLRLWFKHLLRDKEPTPSFSEAVFCFVLIMLLQFLAMQPMQSTLMAADPGSRDRLVLQLLLIQQMAIIATPALMMGIMLTTDFRKTFRVNLPSPQFLGLALVLPMALHPLSYELVNLIPWPDPLVGANPISDAVNPGRNPWWLILLVMAIAPAVCEEVAYRGFILSGFSKAGRLRLGIVLSSLAFGLMHMIPQQVFNASLMGIVLAVIAIRSHSLLPCILFHFVNNAIGVTLTSLKEEDVTRYPVSSWFMTFNADHELHYTWLTLMIGALVAGPALWWLLSRPGERLQKLTAGRLRLTPLRPDVVGS